MLRNTIIFSCLGLGFVQRVNGQQVFGDMTLLEARQVWIIPYDLELKLGKRCWGEEYSLYYIGPYYIAHIHNKLNCHLKMGFQNAKLFLNIRNSKYIIAWWIQIRDQFFVKHTGSGVYLNQSLLLKKKSRL